MFVCVLVVADGLVLGPGLGRSDGEADGLEVGESDGEPVGLALGRADGFGLGRVGDGAALGKDVVGAFVVVAGCGVGCGDVAPPVPAQRQIQRKTEPCSGRVTPQKQQIGLNPPPIDDGGTAEGATGWIGAGVGAIGAGVGSVGDVEVDDPGCRHVHVALPPVGGGSAPQIHVGKPLA